MTFTVDQLGKAIVAAGLMPADELKALWSALPSAERPKNGEAFAGLLVQRGLLTPFQSQELLSGTGTPLVLGDYVLLAKIGAGGMGQVFKAQHRHMDRMAAIKLLPAAMTKDEAAVKRFQREVKAAARLSHPNIVQAHDASVQRGVWYLVMECVEGRDLSAVVTAEGPLPVDRAVDYIRQTAKGLAFAHENGVVHRDIKPANLLLDKKGTVKILDMGLARLDSATATAAAQDGLTQSGQVMGTVDYMAPEQAFDTRSADARADIYSLGCTLYRLLTAQSMYDGDTIVQKLMAHQNKPIPSLTAKRPDAPAALVAIFERMVAKRPEDRYQTMAEVEAELALLESPQSSRHTPCAVRQPGEQSSDSADGTRSVPATMGVATLTQPNAAAPKTDDFSPTIALDSAQHTTDPVSDRSIQVARENTPQVAVARRPPVWSEPRVLLGGGLGAILLVALGIWVIIRDKDGNEIAKIKVPDGGSATIQDNDPVPTTKGGPSNPPRAATIDYQLDLSAKTDAGFARAISAGDLPLDAPCTVEMYATPRTVSAKNHGLFSVSGGMTLKHFGDLWCWVAMPESKNADSEPLVDLATNPSAQAGRRVHLAGVLTKNDIRLFVDGKLTETTPLSGPLKKLRGLVGIGYDSSNPSWEPFDGTVDEVRISTVARYSENFTPLPRFEPDDKTWAIYHCDEGSGRTLVDSSGNYHHGTIIGAMKWVRADRTGATGGLSGSAPRIAIAPFDAAQARAHQEAWARHLGTTVETTNRVGAKMILIPPGEFLMGSSDEQVAAALKVAEESNSNQHTKDRIQAERRQHRVVITKPLRMGATEVTVGQFRQFVDASKYVTEAEQYGFGNSTGTVLDDKVQERDRGRNWRAPGYSVTDDMPVAQVSWNDAVAYCQWLSAHEKATYRLPTEAEWEYACRAGTTTQYSFGDDANVLEQYAWYNKNGGSGKSHPVGTKPPNVFGLHDMHGNLWEWYQDFYDEKWYAQRSSNDPIGPAAGSYRVIRGGDWYANASLCRCAYRASFPPSYRSFYLGFRCVRVLDAPAPTALQPLAPGAK